jgi:hypothetical protein
MIQDSFGITLARITAHCTERGRTMGDVISFHPPKSSLILLYEVVDEAGNAEWGGERPEEALAWIANSPTAVRILVSGWESDEEDAQLIGQPLDVTDLVKAASR